MEVGHSTYPWCGGGSRPPLSTLRDRYTPLLLSRSHNRHMGGDLPATLDAAALDALWREPREVDDGEARQLPLMEHLRVYVKHQLCLPAARRCGRQHSSAARASSVCAWTAWPAYSTT